ncbi:sporulation integral membrane protein YlbJ [Salicibibacter halophilus]|uniref:Sporulation integral membrane protein YlbJ n=1 Tax=Salicibibacter halophilus TaxID=2502791 RepID=A0A514LFI0_9BACI|nr:sporulation integral membrane protein YlbJ [Salicibibacter halophilus]QDI90617.1 sporulation integral membrane protein YlbJ [Salicibibacter halophilus]
MTRSHWQSLLLGISAVILATSLMVFPQEAFDASLRGLSIWWDVVFPSLLPFFIISELLISFGVVSFLGAFMEPFMRPLFKVPGTGGFVWAMGIASGYPAGAKMTTRLWKDKRITTIEAERLVSFTNASNPLFLFGAIAVGFFHDPALGILLAVAHYGANFFVGIIMRFHGKEEASSRSKKKLALPSVKAAFQMLHEERLRDDRPIGKILGDAVQSSVQTLLMIGGFIILFSVINEILSLLNVTAVLAMIVGVILAVFQFSSELSVPMISGLFEMTLGSQLASLTDAPLKQKIIITSFMLAFAGFSAQAQAGSLMAETDIRFRPFFIARCLQGVIAAILTYLCWNALYRPDGIAVFTGWGHPTVIREIWEMFLLGSPYFTLGMLVISICIFHKRRMKASI